MKRPVNPANLHAKVEAIESLIARIPSAPTEWRQETTIYKAAHGLVVGDPVCQDGTKSIAPYQQTLGMVSQVLSPDAVVVTTGGIVSGLSGLTPGQVLGLAEYPVSSNWYETAGNQLGSASIYALAISDTEALVFPNKIISNGPISQTLSCWISDSSAITGIGQLVGPDPAALPQADTRAHALVTGVVVLALPLGLWLIANTGSWTTQVSSGSAIYAAGDGVRYLSEDTPGAATTTEPPLSVLVYHVKTSSRTDYPSDPSPATYYVTITPLLAAAQAPGVLPLELGGAGTDLTAQPDHAVLFKFNNTQLGSVINTGGLMAVLTQTASGLPVYKSLDDSGFEDTATGLRPLICGEPILDETPESGAFLRYIDGEWQGFRPWINEGELATIGTSGDLIRISPPTADGDVLTADLSADGCMVWAPPSGGGGSSMFQNVATKTTTGAWSWTVPAGIEFVMVVGVGGGGGAPYSGWYTNTAYYFVDSTGARSDQAQVRDWGGCGGGGGIFVAFVKVTPGDTLSGSIGVAGSTGTSGTRNGGSGGDTTCTGPGSMSLIANGGKGGAECNSSSAPTNASLGGTVTITNACGYGIAGQNGDGADASVRVNMSYDNEYRKPGRGIYIPGSSTEHGKGGRGGRGTGSPTKVAAEAGALAIFY